MEAIRIDIADWYIVVFIQLRRISLVCKETKDEFDMEPTRTYDFPSKEAVKSVDLIGEYLHIYFNDGTDFQIKLQSSSEIVLDYFTAKGEMIREIGAWDFWID